MAASPNPRDLLSACEVAVRLSITVRTLRRWVELGCFPRPVRIGRKYVRWRRRDVEAYFAGLRPH
jgi:predicted DNA-binding transcriptional regulator AlpA